MESDSFDFFGEGRPSLQDRIDIGDLLSALSLYVDLLEFDKVEQLFTEDAVMDYSSLFGSERGVLKAKDQLLVIRTFIAGFDATQHMQTNFDIRTFGDRAAARCQGHSFHRIDERHWGRRSLYVYRLVRTQPGWKISYMQTRQVFEMGDKLLIEEARKRLIAGFRRPALGVSMTESTSPPAG